MASLACAKAPHTSSRLRWAMQPGQQALLLVLVVGVESPKPGQPRMGLHLGHRGGRITKG